MIRERTPDIQKSRSLLQASEQQFKIIQTLPCTEEFASIIVKECYDSFRMLGEAALISQGKEASHRGHHRIVLNEILHIKVKTERPLGDLLILQELRRKIEYEGYRATILDAEDSISITKTCFPRLLEAVKKEVKL